MLMLNVARAGTEFCHSGLKNTIAWFYYYCLFVYFMSILRKFTKTTSCISQPDYVNSVRD